MSKQMPQFDTTATP